MIGVSTFFDPQHVVIVGASADPERIGGRPIAFLRRLGFAGTISPVNPSRTEIGDLPCYPSVADVPGEPDLVLVAVKTAEVVGVLEAAGRRGIKAAIIFTAGFGETGSEGAALEREIARVVRETGIRVCGPNTVGIITAPAKAPLTFATCLDSTDDLGDGSIGIISQSGAVGAFIHRECQLRGHPLRHLVAAGNEVDVTAGEFLEYMVEDPGTRAVGLYLEGIRAGSTFIAGLKRARELGKPVVVLKVGSSELAKAAAVSHTGALAGDDVVTDAVLRQYGAIRVHDLDDLLACLELATELPSLPEHGGVSVISISGGIGVWAADMATELGLAIPALSEQSQRDLTELLPAFANVANPVDVTAQVVNQPDLLAGAVEIVAADPGIDLIMVAIGIQDAKAHRLAEGIITAFRASSGRMAVSWMAGPDAALDELRDAGIPVFTRIGEGLRAMMNLARWAHARATTETGLVAEPETLEPLGLEGVDLRTEFGAKGLLTRIGIPSPSGLLADSEQAAVDAFVAIGGGPVVVKGQVEGIAHKSDFGLVELGVTTPEGMRAAYQRIRSRSIESGILDSGTALACLVEQQVIGAVELLLGARHDPVFGTVIVVGLGGTNTELTRSFATRIAPLDEIDVDGLLLESRALVLLSGFRGEKKVENLDALRATIRRFARFAMDNADRLQDIEINPLAVVRETGEVVALDAVMVDTTVMDGQSLVTEGAGR